MYVFSSHIACIVFHNNSFGLIHLIYKTTAVQRYKYTHAHTINTHDNTDMQIRVSYSLCMLLKFGFIYVGAARQFVFVFVVSWISRVTVKFVMLTWLSFGGDCVRRRYCVANTSQVACEQN